MHIHIHTNVCVCALVCRSSDSNGGGGGGGSNAKRNTNSPLKLPNVYARTHKQNSLVRAHTRRIFSFARKYILYIYVCVCVCNIRTIRHCNIRTSVRPTVSRRH